MVANCLVREKNRTVFSRHFRGVFYVQPGQTTVKEISFEEALNRFQELFDEVEKEGALRIRRKDGKVFVLKVEGSDRRPPLDVEGVETDLTLDEILQVIREGREGRS